MWTDSHCHLQDERTPPDVLSTAAQRGVTRVVCVGTDLEQSRRAIDLARRWPGTVWATVGVHPHDAAAGTDGLAALLDEPGVVAVGECGLDYHYDHSPRPAQRDVFAEQVALARSRGLALVVHTREAWDDTFAILASEGAAPEPTVLHCFTGGPEEARRALDAGAHLSFSGIVTFNGADQVRAAAALCPDDRLLVETDSPYLTPVPHRGQPNHPGLVPLVGAAVAAARGVPVDHIEALTWNNAEAVFGLATG